jgi:hypothetical protein
MKKLSEWLAVTAPLKAVEACSICSKIPRHCSCFEKSGELVHDDIPPEVKHLGSLIAKLGRWRGEILQCPECRRAYWHDYEYEYLAFGSEDTWTYLRVEPEVMFHDDWFIRYRLGDYEVDTAWSQDYFRQHSFAKLESGRWIALHDEGEVTPIVSPADLVKLAAIDPPVGLEEPKAAKRYLYLVERIDHVTSGNAMTSFDKIRWRSKLTDEDKARIEDLRAASRVEPEQLEKLADRVLVKRWLISDRRLIYRIITVFPNGAVTTEDAVIGEDLPID